MDNENPVRPDGEPLAASETVPAGEEISIPDVIAGFMFAAFLALIIFIICFASEVLILMLAGGFLGSPASGLMLWAINRNKHRGIARGALVFGIVGFIMSGVCLVGSTVFFNTLQLGPIPSLEPPAK